MEIDRTHHRVLQLFETEPEIPPTAIGERIGASQATVWRRIQVMRDEGLIPPQVVRLDRRKASFNAMIFAQVKLP